MSARPQNTTLRPTNPTRRSMFITSIAAASEWHYSVDVYGLTFLSVYIISIMKCFEISCSEFSVSQNDIEMNAYAPVGLYILVIIQFRKSFNHLVSISSTVARHCIYFIFIIIFPFFAKMQFFKISVILCFSVGLLLYFFLRTTFLSMNASSCMRFKQTRAIFEKFKNQVTTAKKT